MSFDLEFGRYAAFIWPAYAATAAAFAWMVSDSLFRARRWRREAERLEAARPVPEARPAKSGTDGA